MSSPNQLFEIEKEYDNRYEGFDYDDFDELPHQLADSDDEGRVAVHIPPDAPEAANSSQDPFEALARAEEEEEKAYAKQNHKSRLLERLEGADNRPATGHNSAATGTVTALPSSGSLAGPLATSQKRLASAIAANSDLLAAGVNPNASAAALALALAPKGASKTTVLSKLAHAVRAVPTATSRKDLEALGLPTTPTFKLSNLGKEIARACELAAVCGESPERQEVVVRALFNLATAPITASLLASCGQAGKKVRKLKIHQNSSVAQAAAATVEAWKACITSD